MLRWCLSVYICTQKRARHKTLTWKEQTNNEWQKYTDRKRARADREKGIDRKKEKREKERRIEPHQKTK